MKAETSVPEIWKPIDFKNDWYEVSNLGNVRRRLRHKSNRGRWRVLKNHRGPCGYSRTFLSCEGKNSQFFTHRLVAAAFLGPIPPGLQVNHKNGVRTDNRAENLEYVTPKENVAHATHVLGRPRGGFSTGRYARAALALLPKDSHA